MLWASARMLGHKAYGKLDFQPFSLPGIYPMAFAVGGLHGWHGLQLFLSNKHSSMSDIVRHKTLCDATSILSLIPLIAFLPANWFSYRNETFERGTWFLTMTVPLAMYTADLVTMRKEKYE